MTDVYASSKVIRISPRKVGEVVSLIRGRSAADALTILEHTPRRAAVPLAKLVKSGIANAENNAGLDTKTLMITEIQTGPSLTLKRFRPASHGRAQRYKKQASRVKLTISGEKRVSKKKATETKPAAAKTEAKKEEK